MRFIDPDHLLIDRIEDFIRSLVSLDDIGIDPFGNIREFAIDAEIEIGDIFIELRTDLVDRTAKFVMQIVGPFGIV